MFRHHWLLRASCSQSEGSSISGSGFSPSAAAPRVLDTLYIRSLLDDAPDDALAAAAAAIADIQRERASKKGAV